MNGLTASVYCVFRKRKDNSYEENGITFGGALLFSAFSQADRGFKNLIVIG